MAHKQKTVGEVHRHNRESEGVSTLFPFQLRTKSAELISFLEDYYKFLNQKDQPTNVIDRIQTEHDIDLADAKYLEELKKEIAKNIPNSDVLDNRQLFRNILDFYKTRGSQDSISTFFRLFFDDVPSVIYPADFLFKPSSGDINVSGFTKQDGTRVEYNATTSTFSSAIPTGPTILTPDFVPADPGYLKIGSDFEDVFWTYGNLAADKSFRIRVTKDRSDSGFQSPLNSPGGNISGFAVSTRLNSGDNKLSSNLTNNSPLSITIDTSEIVYDSPNQDFTYRLGTYVEDSRIFQKNLDTDEVTVFQDINSPNEPYAKTLDLTNRHLYFGEKEQLGIVATGRNHTILSTRAGGKYFSDVILGTPDKETVYNFYAFEDTTIKYYIDYEQDFSPDDTFTPSLVEKKRVKAGDYATFITDTYGSPDQHIVFFESTGNIAGSTYTTAGAQDMTVLSPMSSDYVSRGDPNSPTGESTKIRITWDLTNRKLDADLTTSVRHTNSADSPPINAIYGVVHINDGLQQASPADGNDKCQGIPVGYCNDTYLWPDGLTGYTIVSPYDSNEIKAYQFDYSTDTWDLHETITPTKNIANQTGSYSGDVSPADGFIGPNSPQLDGLWKFEGTYPFALWINDKLDDEELVWGWNRKDYNLPIFTQFAEYSGRKGFMSDVNKLHDGDKFQEFSYIINTGVSIDRWRDSYNKLVHPAGMKLFAELQIESFVSRTDRTIVPNYNIGENQFWYQNLYTSLQNHTPFYQPGWLDESGLVNLFITPAAFNMSVDEAKVDQDLLSTYALRFDTSSVSGVLSIRLTTNYVETNTDYVLIDTSDSNSFLSTSTFNTGIDEKINSPIGTSFATSSVETDSYVSWGSAIDAIDTSTIGSFVQPLEVTNLSSVRAKLGSTTAVTEHQSLKVLDRVSPLTDVFFPETGDLNFSPNNSPTPVATVTETFV